MRRLLRRPDSVTALSSFLLFVLGAIIGTILQNLILIDLLATIPLVLVFSTLSLMVIMTAQSDRHTATAQDEIRDRMRGIDSQVNRLLAERVTVQYYDASQAGGGLTIFDEAQKLVSGAKDSILVLNSFILESASDATAAAAAARDRYFTALLERAAAGVIYRRVFQRQRREQKPEEIGLGAEYQRHFQALLHLLLSNDQLRSTVSIQAAPARRLLSFILVDGRSLLLQVERQLSENDLSLISDIRLESDGLFVIHDPQGQITKPFKVFFDALMVEATPIQLGEL